jgi:hypothetical protein
MPKKKVNIYEVWQTDGRYIQGKKIHKKKISLDAAKALATKVDGYYKLETATIHEKNVAFWIEDKELNPIGLISEE